MTDASTHRHRHAHDPAHDPALRRVHAELHAPNVAAPASALEASALARLAGLSLILGGLWAAVVWALH